MCYADKQTDRQIDRHGEANCPFFCKFANTPHKHCLSKPTDTYYTSIVKPTRYTIFEFIEYHSTCFGRSTGHKMELQFDLLTGSMQSTNLYDIPDAVCTVLNS
jgi:hypothetical protein